MLELLLDQDESNRLFREWTRILVAEAKAIEKGWIIEGSGVVFTNYHPGKPGTIENEVMLGADQDFQNGIVKLVQPKTSQGDTGKLTAIAQNKEGRHFLLRQGRLSKNYISRVIIDDFALLTGLAPVQVNLSGKKSVREWYVVADLGAKSADIIKMTVEFTLACVKARAIAGGGASESPTEVEGYGFGLDESGRIFKGRTSWRNRERDHVAGFCLESPTEDCWG